MPRKTFLRFFAADTAAGSPAAPLETPAAPPAVSGEIDIANYNPTDINIADIMGEEPPEKVEKPPGDVKPPEPGKQPAAKKDPDLGNVANLRKAYETTKAENEARAKELETVRSELAKAKTEGNKDWETKLGEREKALKERDERIAAMEKEMTLQNPLASRELRELESGFNTDMAKVFRRVPKFQANFTAHAQEFMALDPAAADYADKYEAFKDTLENQYGRDADKVLDAVEKAAEFQAKRAETHQRIVRDGSKIVAQEQAKNWTAASERINETYENAFKVPDDIAASDPYNPVLMVNRMEKVAGEETAKKIDGAVRKMIATAMVGFKPKTPDDYAGMSTEEIAAAQNQERSELIATHQKFIAQSAVGMKLFYYTRSFFKDYMALNEERERRAAAAPRDPTKGGKDDAPGGAEKKIDVANYVPPAPVSERDLVGG